MENKASVIGAVLLDTRSIQKYVFGCNELKTNIGASYIVDKIFEEIMCNKVLAAYDSKAAETNWKHNREIMMLKKPEIEYEVAYIGGGNMLLLVRQQGKTLAENLHKCRELVKEWSKQALLYAPGLKTGAAVGELDISEDGFKKSLNALYQQLKDNQNKVLPEVDLPYTGLTKECDVSGKTADAYDYSTGVKRMLSSEVKAKINACENAEAVLADKLAKLFPGEKLAFANEFEKIGYKDKESYISVIHIDGNNMGVKFSCCKNIQERKQLSQKVQANVEAAFDKLLQKIVAEYASYEDYLDYETMTKGSCRILPIRPIIIGGDDITFVCPGRLGLHFAQYFMEQLCELPLLDDARYKEMSAQLQIGNGGAAKNLNKNLSCCAGVAVVPAKYPFFRAYDLAEQLCGAAKKNSRANDDSWLDFAILHGEMTPELEQLRQQQYVNLMGDNLHGGPYQVKANGAAENSLGGLLDLAEALDYDSDSKDIWKIKVARNKVKKLREVLCGDNHGVVRFLENTPEIKKILCDKTCKAKADVSAADFWENGTEKGQRTTKFIDAIEIIDFIPVKKGR